MNVKLFVLYFMIIFLSVSGFTFAQDNEIEELDLTGQIAYVGNDYNIYTVNLSTSETFKLTEDGRGSARYEFPTWSPGGQLAYFCCSVRGLTSARLSIFISPDGKALGEEFYNQQGERHVYAYWSPQTCDTESCVDLAVLVQNFSEPQLAVELFNSQNASDGQRNLGQGSPFYYSWSPTGESLLLHRNNATLQYYSVASSDVDSAFEGDLGSFLSPGWSPVDDRILFATSEEDMTRLTVLSDDTLKELVDDIQGVLSFSWSPNGEYIAYRVANSDMVSSVYVIDSITGEMVARSNVSGVLSFFWSPDSTKIAYITLSNPPGSFDINNDTIGSVTYLTQQIDGLAWNLLNIDDSSNTLLSSFVPTVSIQYMLTNFDQFAQSHSIWSPDSSYIVYSELGGDDGQDTRVMILDVDDPDNLPIPIAEGSFAIWSYK